ncbi:MAG TPA: hypothetical protein VFM32_10180, partial [Spongiibacteraceae bacterium]|nr:hypothetical protein [Spongiibacteraceae bacterium]
RFFIGPAHPGKQQFDSPQLQLSATHTFTKPGTYFSVIRVTPQREGNTQTPYGRIQNIARVRVVVDDSVNSNGPTNSRHRANR